MALPHSPAPSLSWHGGGGPPGERCPAPAPRPSAPFGPVPSALWPAREARAVPPRHAAPRRGSLHNATCEETEPAQHRPPGRETLPPGESPAGATGGGGAAAASPPGNILAAHWLCRRPTPPSARPPRSSCARPLAATVTRGGPGRAEEAERGGSWRWRSWGESLLLRPRVRAPPPRTKRGVGRCPPPPAPRSQSPPGAAAAPARRSLSRAPGRSSRACSPCFRPPRPLARPLPAGEQGREGGLAARRALSSVP